MSPIPAWIVITVLFMIFLPIALVVFTERLRIAREHLDHYQLVADTMRAEEGIHKITAPPNGTKTVDPWGVWQDGKWHSYSELQPTRVQLPWQDQAVKEEEAERRRIVKTLHDEDMEFFNKFSPELINEWKKAGYINESEEVYRGVQEL